MTPQQIIDGIVRVAPKYGLVAEASNLLPSYRVLLRPPGCAGEHYYVAPRLPSNNAAAAWLMLEALKEKWKGRPLYSSVIPEHIERLSFLMRDYIAGLTIDSIVTAFIRVGDLLPDPVQRCEKCGQVVSE